MFFMKNERKNKANERYFFIGLGDFALFLVTQIRNYNVFNYIFSRMLFF